MGRRWLKTEDELLREYSRSHKRAETLSVLSEEMERTSTSISGRCATLGIRFFGLSHKDRLGKMRKNIFHKLTPESSYVLGFFCADGYFLRKKQRPYGIGFQIHKKDGYLLEKFKKIFDIKSPVKSINKTMTQRLGFTCREYINDLEKLGITLKNKTHRIRTPRVPKVLMPDFIRGYLDGDGCFYIDKRRKSLCVEFVGNEGFLRGIQGVIAKSLRISVPNPTRKIRSTFRLRLYGDKAKTLAKWIYKSGSTLFLNRKKVIADRAGKK